MSKPVVGITAALEDASWVAWRDVEVNLSPRTYSTAIAATGAIPLILPADDASAGEPGALIDLLDALVLAGGADLDPSTYGAERDERTAGFRAERDRFEVALAREAIERDLPLLAVCRGMEVLNVACGGALAQHLDDAETLHIEQPGRFSIHDVRLEPGSLAARAVGDERATVHSHHHQGIGTLGDGLVVTGWAEPGGTIEAIEIPERKFALGLLWHPEEDAGSRPFPALTEAAEVGAVR